MFEHPKPEVGLVRRLGVFWCGLMHDAPMWPIHGTYQCRICAQSYAVPLGRQLRTTAFAGRDPAR